MPYSLLKNFEDKRRIPLSSNTIKIDFDLLQNLVFEANQQDRYTTKKDIAKKYSKITKYKTRLESPRALDILNLLETPKEKVDRVFENILSSSEPVDLKYIKTAKVKAASDASAWRSKIAQDTNLDIAFTNRVLNNNSNYLKNKKLFDYLSASQLLKTELKDMTLSEQLKYADQAILGRPQYSGITMSKGGNKKGRILRDPAHKVMEFALRNFNQNKGQGAVKFFDSKGKLIKYEPGIKIPYQKSNFSYGGKKHYVKDLRKPGYMQKFFPEVFENQTAINKLLNKEVDNPFKKGKKIIFGDLMNKIQVKGYGWSPQAGVLDVLHGSNGVINEPFTNLSLGTRRLNAVLRDIEVGKYGKGLKQKLVKQAFGDLKNLKGDELIEGIVNQQLNIAKQVAKGKTFEKPRVQVAKELLKSNVPLGNRESIQLKQLISKMSPNKSCAVRLKKSEGGGVSGLDQCFEEGMKALKEKNISKPHQVQGAKQLMNAGKRIGAGTFARRLLDLGILGEVAFIAGDTGIRMAMGRPFNEAFKAATFRETSADLDRQKRAGFTEREMLISKAGNLENKAFSIQQQIDAAEDIGDDVSVGPLQDRLKKIEQELNSPIDNKGTKLQNLLLPTNPTNIEATRKLENVIDSDRAKSIYSAGQLKGQLMGDPEIVDDVETEAVTMRTPTIERQALPSSQEYLRQFMRQSLPGSEELEDRTIDRFIEGLSPMEKFELEALDQSRAEKLYGTQGKFREGGLANLTTTVAPQSGPNSKGLESLRKYATKTY